MAALTVLAVSAAVTAAASVSFGTLNYMASEDAAEAAKNLAAQRAEQLRAQQAAKASADARAAISGQSFGPRVDDGAAGGYGFGSGNTNTGLGRGSLTGGS